MTTFKREKIGRYALVHRGEKTSNGLFIKKAMDPERRLAAGRGSPGLFEFNGRMLVCRQYLHGGWLRGITKGAFLGEGRAEEELDITAYLEESGFPVIKAVGYISRRRVIANHLFFITVFKNDARDLLEYFRYSDTRDRLRMVKKLAASFFRLGQLGVYHPDLHLRNILVDPAGGLFFLDFDKSVRRESSLDDYERMFWRLDRYARKNSASFGRPVSDLERALFLRTFERLSGQTLIPTMMEKRKGKQRTSKLGWLIDRIFYGKR